jgi:recombination protein RecA
MVKMTKHNFFDDVIDKFGKDILVTDDEQIEAISTGSLSLDASIGIGGIPVGRVTEFWGVEGSAKTTLALCIARNAIKMGKKVLYVDAENMIDYYTVTALLGEELDKNMLILLHPDTAEDNLGACEMGIRSGEFGMIILDSIGALSPEKEREKELTDLTVGITPKLLSLFLRRNMADIRNKKVAFLFINQVRDKIGAYVPTFEPPGGHALKHFASVIISLSRGQEIKQGDTSVGLNIKFVVKKNKMSAPFRSFIIPLFFGTGVDTNRDLVSFAEMLGVLKKRGSYYVYEDETIGQGVVKTIDYLKEHQEVLDSIKKQVYNCIDKGSFQAEELSEFEITELEKEGDNGEKSKN